jgi:hypothetical protein
MIRERDRKTRIILCIRKVGNNDLRYVNIGRKRGLWDLKKYKFTNSKNIR